MILTIDANNAAHYASELDQAFEFRHRIFVEEAGWEAQRKPDGREVDQFDDEHATHMLLYDRSRLIGYQRMLPTTRPYLLTTVYPQLCDGEAPCSPNIYEWTRFCVERPYRGDGRGLGGAGAQLVLAFVEWGLARGIDHVVVEQAPAQLLKFVQCRFMPAPLGVIQRINGADVIAVIARFDQRTRVMLQAIVEAEALAPRLEA